MNGLMVRPVPTPEQQADAERRIDWDAPVGTAHAHRLLEILNGRAA